MRGALGAPLADVVDECLAFLAPFRREEFLFRVPGNKTVVDEAVRRLERGDARVLGKIDGATAHDACSVLKKYLADGSEPALPTGAAKMAIRRAAKVQPAGDQDSKARRKASLGSTLPYLRGRDKRRFDKALRALLPSGRGTLAKILPFVAELAEHETETKMSAQALAVCLAPSLFLDVLNEARIAKQLQTAIWVTRRLIESAGTLLDNCNDGAEEAGADDEEELETVVESEAVESEATAHGAPRPGRVIGSSRFPLRAMSLPPLRRARFTVGLSRAPRERATTVSSRARVRESIASTISAGKLVSDSRMDELSVFESTDCKEFKRACFNAPPMALAPP